MNIDLTFVIQGPIDIISVNTIDAYLKYGKVIVSCWDNDSITDEMINMKGGHNVCRERYDLLEPYLDKITVIKSKYNEAIKNIHQPTLDHELFQAVTTLAGLEKVDTEFAVKTRSDESYPDIDPILNKVKKNPDKIYTLNCNAFKDSFMKFNMGSHFLLSKTKYLKRAYQFRHASEFCRPTLKVVGVDGEIHNESRGSILSTLGFLIALGEIPDWKKSAEQVKKYFDITAQKELKNFLWSQQSHKTKINKKSFQDRSIIKSDDPFRGINYDRNFSNPTIANHIDEV